MFTGGGPRQAAADDRRAVVGPPPVVDGGAWQAAQLGRALSRATWVQWLLPWQATPGEHLLEVRATDGTGAVQTATRGGPAPAGATGYDQVAVSVH